MAGYILTMIYTGMRYGDLKSVLIDNIHIDEQYLVRGVKTEVGIDRIIPLCNKIVPVVAELMKDKEKTPLDMYEELFYNEYYETLKKAKIRKLVPHTCRHTCASALAELGVPPIIIQQILGHTDYATTANKYTLIDFRSLIESVNKIE